VKTVIATLIATSVFVGLIVPVSAVSSKNGQKDYQNRAKSRNQRYIPKTRPPNNYYQHDSNTLPFGSQIWWEQLERERS
jgi:hypothetical protein